MDADAVVVGAGFGGLGAALTLAERGARVVVLEALAYPGGCASTFTRKGRRFEAGATLFGGFEPGQLFGRWIREHDMAVELLALDPVISFRAPGMRLDLPPSRPELLARLCALPDAPVAGLRSFFAEQGRVADALWAAFDDPGLLPPFAPGALATHLRRSASYAELLRLVGRPLHGVLRRHGVHGYRPLTAWLDGLCQITVQVGVAEAEAPLALAAMDFPFRGARHVVGGVGRLAEAMVRAIEARGGTVRLADRVKGLRREGGVWVVEARGGALRAPQVLANLLPQSIPALVGAPVPALDDLSARVAGGWGAAMLYLALAPGVAEGPHHIELVQDLDRPYRDGNHLFVSVGDVDAAGGRPATVSTHLSIPELRGRPSEEVGREVARVQERMREGLGAFLPGLLEGAEQVHPASPRTFARFTRRPEGLVGGIPRRAGLEHYRGIFPEPVLPGLWLVGDSAFPGQSTLATAVGGRKVAEAALSA